MKLDPGRDSRHVHAREDNDNVWYVEVRKEAKPPNLLVDAIACLMIFFEPVVEAISVLI